MRLVALGLMDMGRDDLCRMTWRSGACNIDLFISCASYFSPERPCPSLPYRPRHAVDVARERAPAVAAAPMREIRDVHRVGECLTEALIP